MSWCFAKINGRLAEIYFDEAGKNSKGLPKIWGHCYINYKTFKTKEEKKWIMEDTAKYQFSYRNDFYRDKKTLARIKRRNFKEYLKFHNNRNQS